MRTSFLPPPGEEEIRSFRVHELVRDYPELLPPLEALGVDPGVSGGKAVGEVLPSGGAWVGELLAELRWRGGGWG